jgi:lactoylglutathione lyase
MKNFIILIALTLGSSWSCLAQKDTSMWSLSFNHMAIPVRDLEKSLEFYTRILKLKDITGQDQIKAGLRWVSLGEGKELHLLSTTEPVTVNKGVHLALRTNDMTAFTKNLGINEIKWYDWMMMPYRVSTRFDGVKQVYFQDPDGYWIEVNDAK